MEKRVSKILGIALVLIGIIFISNSAGITGFVVLENITKTAGSILGLAFIVGGVLMLQMRESEEGEGKLEKGLRAINQELKSGATGTYKDVLSFAKDLNYGIKTGGGHQLNIVNKQKKIVESLPTHPGDMGKGIYRKILKTLRDRAAANY